jgi:hypothetical protein
MDAILARLPDPRRLRRHTPKLAGFAFGVVLCLVGGMLITVIYTGHGYFVDPPRPEVVYPNF